MDGAPDPAELRERLTEALDRIVDPCSSVAGVPAGMVEMGLIRDLRILEGEGGLAVSVVVRVTHPSCFVAPFFLAEVQNLIVHFPEVSSIDATLDTGYDWTPEDMSGAYRERLARYRRARGLPGAGPYR